VAVVTVRTVMEPGTPPLDMAPEMGLAVIRGRTRRVGRTRRAAAFSIRFPAANPLIPGRGRRAELIRGRFWPTRSRGERDTSRFASWLGPSGDVVKIMEDEAGKADYA
jgi:hypothetical protein